VRMRRPVRWLAVIAGVAYAAVATLSRPLTAAAAVAVAIPVAIVLVRSVRRRPPPTARAAVTGPRRRTAAAWGTVVILAAALELVAFSRQPAYNVATPDFPTLSVLLDPLTVAGPTRFVLWCCWLWAGWALARR
jgi:hypothetical protein